MRKRIALVCALAAAGSLAGLSPAQAVCHNGTSRAVDIFGNHTNEDTLLELPTGHVVYGDGAESQLNPGYLGVTGPNGFIEISGNADDAPNVQVDGSTNDGQLEGRAGADSGGHSPLDLCINGTEIL